MNGFLEFLRAQKSGLTVEIQCDGGRYRNGDVIVRRLTRENRQQMVSSQRLQHDGVGGDIFIVFEGIVEQGVVACGV